MDLYVIDTSSIIQLWPICKQYSVKINTAFKHLSKLVTNGQLVYPVQVMNEITVETNRSYEWVRQNKAQATRFGTNHQTLKEILSKEIVQKVVDVDSKKDEADPYVISLAVDVKNKIIDEESEVNYSNVTVITEDRVDRLPRKISLRSACDILAINSINIESFLLKNRVLKIKNN